MVLFKWYYLMFYKEIDYANSMSLCRFFISIGLICQKYFVWPIFDVNKSKYFRDSLPYTYSTKSYRKRYVVANHLRQFRYTHLCISFGKET